VNEIPLSFK